MTREGGSSGEAGALWFIIAGRTHGRGRDSLQPIEGAARPARSRLWVNDELLLALLPTLTVLVVHGLVEVLSQQRLLFASLASSAFLIYLDPNHGTSTIRALVSSHVIAATTGLITYGLFVHGYLAAGTAMVATILAMILLDVVHPPAVSTSLGFAPLLVRRGMSSYSPSPSASRFPS